MRLCSVLLTACVAMSLVVAGSAVADSELPVVVPGYPLIPSGVRNPLTFEQIHNIIGPDPDGQGLMLDLGDTSYSGVIYTGPYPFEANESDYDYARYRLKSDLVDGVGTLPISPLFRDKYNANDWPAADMSLGYRLDLFRMGEDGIPTHLGFYDTVVSFLKQGDVFERNLTITEGPFVCLVRSDDPTSLAIAWETDQECTGYVYARYMYDRPRKRTATEWKLVAVSENTQRHEALVTGLQPSSDYEYYVLCSNEAGQKTESRVYAFRTAPGRTTPGFGKKIRFAFVSDSREGVGGGEQTYMGHNFAILSKIALDAHRRGADFFLFGGDLVNGYTTEPEDFRLQLRGWKQSLAGFWRTKPVYPAMGNHETLLNCYGDGSEDGICLDKWPYQTQSAEAIFAHEFYNPTNGPEASDPRRPTYKENVYHFRYGPVLLIAFNNNYWWTTNDKVQNYGGSPEGYMMGDQLEWVENVLNQAEKDRDIRYIILFAQEPVFPCGGHVKDAMWYNGNNNIRAATSHDGETVVPERQGMIEARNRFWEAIAKSSKVAAVLAGDEHEYHRLLVDKTTPVGVYPEDDTNNDGVLDTFSSNPEFDHPTWQITAGTGGAPYYSREETPWQPVYLSSQAGYCMFEADAKKISMTYYSITGQVVDYVENLMEVK